MHNPCIEIVHPQLLLDQFRVEGEQLQYKQKWLNQEHK